MFCLVDLLHLPLIHHFVDVVLILFYDYLFSSAFMDVFFYNTMYGSTSNLKHSFRDFLANHIFVEIEKKYSNYNCHISLSFVICIIFVFAEYEMSSNLTRDTETRWGIKHFGAFTSINFRPQNYSSFPNIASKLITNFFLIINTILMFLG